MAVALLSPDQAVGALAVSDDEEKAALRRRLAELEARAPATDSRLASVRPGAGVAGGFFGCFGVLAAIALCLVALVVCSQVSSVNRGERLAAGGGEARDYVTSCAAALSQITSRHPQLGGASLAGGDPVLITPGALPVVACAAASRRGSIAYTIQVICGDALDRGCTQVRLVELDGKALGLP